MRGRGEIPARARCQLCETNRFIVWLGRCSPGTAQEEHAMTSTQPQPTGSKEKETASGGKEIVLLVAVLAVVAIGTVATYWVRSRNAEASNQAGVTTTVLTGTTGTPAEARTRTRVVAPAPISPDADAVHTDIYFDFKSTRLRADAARRLQDQAAQMERTSTWVVLIQGYADSQGPVEYNRLLAQRRAESVKQFLVELGVPESSIKVVTIGKEGALCDDPSRECQQLNRRVHLEIRKMVRAAAAPVRPEIAVGDALETSPVAVESARP
jgi:outer membrane protein OmpA-like peptidoglycan-associated protein